MIEATHSLNAFPVPPTEDPVFILTSGQLQDLITAAVEQAIQPLQDRIEALEATVARQDGEIAALEATQDTQADNQLIQLRLIGQLREAAQKTAAPAPPRGEKTLARIAKIDEILKARGPTTLKELERILKISPKEMNRLLTRLDKRRYEIHSRPGDEREKVIKLKAQIR
jgi:uncharacterized coiled-coil protein SlyX